MKQHKDIRMEFVRQWLLKADEDLALSEHLLSESSPYRTAIVFHAHQSAEKYLKAFLVYHQCEFHKTHDIRQLLDLVEGINPEISVGLQDLDELTPYAVETRYPGDCPDVSDEDAKRAVQLARKAKKIVTQAMREINTPD